MSTCRICSAVALARGLCSTHYARWRRTGRTNDKVPVGGLTAQDRFDRNVNRSAGPDACWPWTGRRDDKGYGRFTFRRKSITAHRFALFGENLPGRDVFACHTCDNPPCVNRAHLYAGASLDNIHDRDSKGRHANWQTVPHAKLTPALATEIRDRYASGKETQQQIADALGISQALVSKVCRNRIWTH